MAKKYIDAEKLERHFENCICEAYNTNGVTEDFEIALKATKNQPAADVQEVVRCKDCKHLKYDRDFTTGRYCSLRNVNGGKYCKDDDFCSYGKRKDGNER